MKRNGNGMSLARRLHEQRIGCVSSEEKLAAAAEPGQPGGARSVAALPEPPSRPLDATFVQKCARGGENERRECSADGFHREAQPSDPDAKCPQRSAATRGETDEVQRNEHASIYDTSLQVALNEGETALTKSIYQPRVAHKVKPLSQSQLNAIDLLILGHSDRSAAHLLGIHPATIGRWRQNHPAFRAELARRRQELWGCAGEMFRAQLQAAVTELKRQLEDSNQDVRFRAASRLLALARWFTPPDEPVDVEGVLTLEARRLNVEKYELHPAQSLVYEDDRAEALEFLMKRAREDFTTGEQVDREERGTKSSKLLDSGI